MSSIARVITREAVAYLDTTEEGWMVTFVPTDPEGTTYVYRRDLGGIWTHDGKALPKGCGAWKQCEGILAASGRV